MAILLAITSGRMAECTNVSRTVDTCQAGPAVPIRGRELVAARSGVVPAVEPSRVVPEALAPGGLRQVPAQHGLDRSGEPALAVGIVRGVHQHVLADQVDDGPGEGAALGDLDALEVA